MLAAQRELAEEADLVADEWHVLVDYYNSPGGSTEAFRCFLARGQHEGPVGERHEREHEERAMIPAWGDSTTRWRRCWPGGCTTRMR